MNFFALTLTFLAAVSLAADKGSIDSSEDIPVDSLAKMNSEKFVYLIGLDLSEIDDVVKREKSADSSGVSIVVCAKKLIGYGAMHGEEDVFTRVTFPGLFDYKLLNEKLTVEKENYMDLKKFRKIFLDCAKFPEAMMAVDVAILKWIVIMVEGTDTLNIDLDVIAPVCCLSVDPDISEYCEDDIIRALEIFSTSIQSSQSNGPIHLRRSLNFLLNLLKFVDSPRIQQKLKDIVTSLYKLKTTSNSSFLDYRLILGLGDAFLATLEKKLPPGISYFITSYFGNAFSRSTYFRFFSKGQIFRLRGLFSSTDESMSKHSCTKATIGSGGNTLVWDVEQHSYKDVKFENSSSSSSSLFIVYSGNTKPPAIFWGQIRSCKTMQEFKELLKSPVMKQTILTCDITLMESNIKFSITDPLKQLDNQVPNA